MPDYNPHDTVTLAELTQLLGADAVRKLYGRIESARWREQCEQLLKRMRVVVDELAALQPTTPENRPRWFALQAEFGEVNAALAALHAPHITPILASTPSPASGDECIACALTEGGVCPDHAAERA